MTTTSEPPKAGFHPSQLIYDTRYRSLTIQVIAFIALMLGLSWLVSNTVANLQALGKDFDFGFLGQRAGYDINQRLVEYDSTSSHARAALVGILNTLLVAVLGCALATVIGVLAGVLRLSKNWLIAKLMAVYVEGFRNIPLLLWILLIFALMTEATPQPRDFREGGDAAMILGDTVAITNRGVFIPAPFWGAGAGILLAVLLLSLVAIFFWRRYAHRTQEQTGRILPIGWGTLGLLLVPVTVAFLALSLTSGRQVQPVLATGASEGMTLADYAGSQQAINACTVPFSTESLNLRRLMRANDLRFNLVPVADGAEAIAAAEAGRCNILSLPASTIAASVPAGAVALSDTITRGNPVEFERPILGGFNFEGGLQLRNSLIALWLALSLYTGAFIAENVRGGILSVSKGQTEAAFALGIKPSRTMRLVILPQALRVIIPPMISQYLNLTKNSSLAIAVGYMDVRSTLGGITINQTGKELEGMLLLGLFYLVTSLVISGAMNVYNSSVKLKER
ncbi:amino acid ABC transporter permease [Limimaricola pyoseonensis]|uniref:General L-amino acid transport system permease protein n=1 Tax=Limimaricola pyoseonensis TaxID=521013 RepID=A0A1G7KZ57_9RHOB|nr:ABC transporter permease subunit [Limimaricola pyoseonensis]SDF42019.1 general L-amino acid transport system permease protein [Limimaricola pyoseonensis]